MPPINSSLIKFYPIGFQQRNENTREIIPIFFQSRKTEGSYLIMKLSGSSGITGDQMPLGEPAIDQADLDLIKLWITEGAKDN
ncbi:MAG: hypothetical protein Kow0098_08970 [Ignavibacteriaceae bacterium]